MHQVARGANAAAFGDVGGNVAGNVTGSVGSLAAQAKTDAGDGIAAHTMSELTQTEPTSTPTIEEALMTGYHYDIMEVVTDKDAGYMYIKNSAGVTIFKCAITDVNDVTTKAKAESGA